MKAEFIATIKNWVANNKKFGWELVPEHFLRKKGKFYHSMIDLGKGNKLQNCCIESGELCLAFKGGFMVWLIEDCVSTAYDPKNPLFKTAY